MTDPDQISLWMAQASSGEPGEPLEGEYRADVAIVGGGYTGLWTAYYLKTLAPELAVCVLEAERCGFGASGRNGGWMMAALEGEDRVLASLSAERRVEVAGLIHGILPEAERVLQLHGLDCDFRRGGALYAAARYPEQERILRHALDRYRALGLGEADYRWMERSELAGRLGIRKPLGGLFTPHVARIQPARLVLGLVGVLEQLGVRIFEQSSVTGVGPDSLLTTRGIVHASHRVLAVEGYSAGLPEIGQRVLAVQSRIIATAPLPGSIWGELGLHDREVFSDASPLVTYGQRSADDRLVFGARGSYRFGGKPRSRFDPQDPGFAVVHRLMLDCFPQLRDVPITHRWGGTLGAARSGLPHAVYDPATGLGTAGGYLGEGVGASNLMARTLVDLILARATPLAGAPWAHRAPIRSALRRWEPEPLRWLGYKATDLARRAEESVYARRAPAWQRRPVAALSRLMERLRG